MTQQAGRTILLNVIGICQQNIISNKPFFWNALFVDLKKLKISYWIKLQLEFLSHLILVGLKKKSWINFLDLKIISILLCILLAILDLCCCGGLSPVGVCGFLIVGGFFCCGPWALGTGSVVVASLLGCSLACGIFLDQGSTQVCGIGRRILYHWVTRGAPRNGDFNFCSRSTRWFSVLCTYCAGLSFPQGVFSLILGVGALYRKYETLYFPTSSTKMNAQPFNFHPTPASPLPLHTSWGLE